MSILLDSLRKSEAQRKIKEAPSIHSAETYGTPSRRAVQWPALALMIAAGLAISWFGWQQFADPGAGGETPQLASTDDAVGPDDNAARQQTPSPQSPRPGRQARTPVERLDSTEEGVPQTPAPDGAPSPLERIAAFVDEEGGTDIAHDESEIDAPLSEDSGHGEDDGANLEDDPGPRAGEAADDFTVLRRPGSRDSSTPDEIAADEPRSYWQLPQSWREGMPEFRITVLVYAEAAEDRFLLMNGERLHEGDEVEGGVVLEEIRRDGAVFSYRQTRFLVKG